MFASSGTPRLVASTNVIIFIEDVNDNAPFFDRQTYTAAIDENKNASALFQVSGAAQRFPAQSFPRPAAAVAVNQRLAAALGFAQVIVTDLDGSLENALITLSIENDPGAHFAITPSGVVSVVRPLDFEVDQQVTVLIRAVDSGVPPLQANATAVITINNLNDNVPVFDQASYSAGVAEDASFGHVVLSGTVQDADLGAFGEVSLAIVETSGATSTRFSANLTQTGRFFVQVIGGLEFDGPSGVDSFALTLRALDGGVPPAIATVPLSIALLDVNDNAPEFTAPSFDRTVAENFGNSTPVVTLTATDKDRPTSPNGQIRFSLVNAAFGPTSFQVDPETGQIFALGPLDFETRTSFTFGAVVSDQGTPARSSPTLLVTITLLDVNDNAPVFDQRQYDAK